MAISKALGLKWVNLYYSFFILTIDDGLISLWGRWATSLTECRVEIVYFAKSNIWGSLNVSNASILYSISYYKEYSGNSFAILAYFP